MKQMAAKKPKKSSVSSTRIDAKVLRDVSGSIMEQITMPQFDPVEQSVAEDLPQSSSGVYVPVPVQKSFSTTSAVTEIFDSLPVSVSEEELLLNSKTARAKVTVDTSNLVFAQNSFAPTFTEFDRAVLEAVLGQLASGNKVMTPGMLFRTMSGKETGTDISDDMLKAVDDSITKCMYTPVILRIVDKETGKTTQTLDGTVLNIVRNRRNVVGHMVPTYEVQSIPIIYTYCKAMNAVTYSPIEMLSVPMSMTKRSLAIMNTLQRAVAPYVWSSEGEAMLSLDEGSNVVPPTITIEYESLYDIAAAQDTPKPGEEEVEIDPKTGKKKRSWFLESKARESVACVLDYWVSMGYIRDWENNKRGRKVVSLSIHLHPIDQRFLPLPELKALINEFTQRPPVAETIVETVEEA